MPDFKGRARELASLRSIFSAKGGALIVLSGRRRVGKSRLLEESLREMPSVLFQATRVTSAINLGDFKTAITRAMGSDPLLESIGNWEGVFVYLAKIAKDRHPGLVVCLDEFPYITDNDPALPSILQRFWDSREAERGAMKIVLCGSEIAQMDELLGARNPLYGRATSRMRLEPLPLREVAEFLPRYEADDIIIAYGIFGGIPYHLTCCDPDISLGENVIASIFTETGPLLEEPRNFLQGSVREPAVYNSILTAIAEGCDDMNGIAVRIGKESKELSPYIDRLTAIGLTEKTKSIEADDKARNRKFLIVDPLTRFWHRFVRGNLQVVRRGQGRKIFEALAGGPLSQYMGEVFEAVTREHCARHSEEFLGAPTQDVGKIWGYGDFDIDVAGTLIDRRRFFGECKWTRHKVGLSELSLLRSVIPRTQYGKGIADPEIILASKSGFDDELLAIGQDDPRLFFVTPDAMVFGAGYEPVSRPGLAS